MSAPPIKPLAAEDAARIRSTVTITSLADVVLGLVKNSLDAGATIINLSIDIAGGRCETEDNGHGIDPSSFADSGGLLKRHWTSKSGLNHVHGRHGLFLAAVADVAFLTITSSQNISSSPAAMAAQFSKVTSRKLPEPGKHSILQHCGTKIIVRDLFGMMPVRVKQRTVLDDVSDRDRAWTFLYNSLVALLLPWRAAVSIRVLDDSQCCKLAIKHSRPPSNPTAAVGAQQNQLDHIWTLLLQANLVDADSRPSWVPVAASNSSFKIRGAISLNPTASKSLQFISFGISPINNDGNANELYREINRIFANSRFGTIDDDLLDEAEAQRRMTDRRFKQDGYTDKTLHGGRKGIDRWPMFVLNISQRSTVPEKSSESIMPTEEGQLSRIVDLIGAMITQWLSEQQFRPQKWQSRKQQLQAQEARRPASASASIHRPEMPGLATANEKGDVPYTASRKRPFSQPSVEANAQIASFESGLAQVDAAISIQDDTDDKPYYTWIHPMTMSKHLIDKRSGAVLPYQDTSLTNEQAASEASVARAQPSKSFRLETKAKPIRPARASSWIQAVINKWDNPIFAPCETGIEQISPVDLEDRVLPGPCNHRSTGSQKLDSCGRSTSESSISVQDLRRASVVAQLDTKFILVQIKPIAALPSTTTSLSTHGSLIVIDQHAADERIKVEELLSSLVAGSDTTTLLTPLSFEVAASEAPLIQGQVKHFARWGITYVLDTSEEQASATNATKMKLTIKTLPAGIAERCVREPRLLIDLLRAETWKRNEASSLRSAAPTRPESANTDRHSWLRSIGDCPAGLTDMINSRACRSALMFNDHLDLSQCKSLISRLADCALPFQCAHGRPSMVPLTGLDSVMDTYPSQYDRKEQSPKDNGFAAAYRSWRQGPTRRS